MNIDSLYTIAEIAVGLVGFAGVATALRSNKGSQLTNLDKVRLYWIVFGGLIVVVGSFLPGWLIATIGSTSLLWFWSSAILLTFVPIAILIIFNPLGKGFNEELRLLRRTTWLKVVLAIGFAAMIPITLNLASWPVASNQAFYEMTLLIALFQTAWTFIDLIVNRET